MATSPIGPTHGTGISSSHEGVSSPSLRPGSPEAFAHFRPHAQGPMVRLDGSEDIDFDGHSALPLDSADLPPPEEVEAQHRSLCALLPDLMGSLALLRDKPSSP